MFFLWGEKNQGLLEQVTKCLTPSWLTVAWVCFVFHVVNAHLSSEAMAEVKSLKTSNLVVFCHVLLPGFMAVFLSQRAFVKISLFRTFAAEAFGFFSLNISMSQGERRGELWGHQACFPGLLVFQQKIGHFKCSSLACLFSFSANYTKLSLAENVNIVKDSVEICKFSRKILRLGPVTAVT